MVGSNSTSRYIYNTQEIKDPLESTPFTNKSQWARAQHRNCDSGLVCGSLSRAAELRRSDGCSTQHAARSTAAPCSPAHGCTRVHTCTKLYKPLIASRFCILYGCCPVVCHLLSHTPPASLTAAPRLVCTADPAQSTAQTTAQQAKEGASCIPSQKGCHWRQAPGQRRL
jgi:hypothetical protein